MIVLIIIAIAGMSLFYLLQPPIPEYAVVQLQDYEEEVEMVMLTEISS